MPWRSWGPWDWHQNGGVSWGTNRLFQVVQGLQEHLGLPLDQALPPVHSLVVQLVLQVLGTQGCQDLLENPGPLSHQ